MAQSIDQKLSIGDAASAFLAKLSAEEKEASQTEVNRFVQWFGRDILFSELTAHGIAGYAEQLSSSDTDYARKLDSLRAFLVYARKVGWTSTGLSTHLKAKKAKNAFSNPEIPESIELTRQGYDELKTELADLKHKRINVIEDIRRAAADKDFRENAPYHAAREQKGHIDGRIMEIEETLKLAVVINGGEKADRRVGIGDSVVLCDVTAGKELSCMIVHTKEVDIKKGKISSVSPIGKAVIGHSEGEVVEISAPAGKLLYQIKQIKH